MGNEPLPLAEVERVIPTAYTGESKVRIPLRHAAEFGTQLLSYVFHIQADLRDVLDSIGYSFETDGGVFPPARASRRHQIVRAVAQPPECRRALGLVQTLELDRPWYMHALADARRFLPEDVVPRRIEGGNVVLALTTDYALEALYAAAADLQSGENVDADDAADVVLAEPSKLELARTELDQREAYLVEIQRLWNEHCPEVRTQTDASEQLRDSGQLPNDGRDAATQIRRAIQRRDTSLKAYNKVAKRLGVERRRRGANPGPP